MWGILFAARGALIRQSVVLPEPVRRVIAAVTAQPGRDWRATELVEIARQSYSALRSSFKATRGETLHDYLQKVRLSQALALLMDERISIKQVSAKLQFRSETYFAHWFRRHPACGARTRAADLSASGCFRKLGGNNHICAARSPTMNLKLILAVTSLLSVGRIHAADITAEKIGSILRFTAAGKTICDYQMEAGDVPEGVSPIFKHGAHLHPVYSPGGKLVTGNHPEDHRWHRGIWMAWTKTEFGDSHPDFWNQGKGSSKDKSDDKILAEVRFDKLTKSWGGPDGGGFVSQHLFLDHSHAADQKVLDESWSVGVSQQRLGDRLANIIDLTSTQTCAGSTALKLPKYHYGGLGVRGNQLWNAADAVTMLTSNGDDRKKGDATKAKWVHIGGGVEGDQAGMVILIHPANFRFPQPLRLNPKNPQLCIAPSQDGDWAIQPGKPYVSKYRILVIDGTPDAKWIEAQWNEYAAAKP